MFVVKLYLSLENSDLLNNYYNLSFIFLATIYLSLRLSKDLL